MKKVVLMIVIFAVLIIYPLCSAVLIPLSGHKENCDTQSGVSVLDELASVSVDKAQKKVDDASNARTEPVQTYGQQAKKQKIENKIKKIESGKASYREVFKDVWFMGDSLMDGLEVYGVLNESRLITQVSASLSHLESNMDKIVGIKPPVLILHYGLNMISDNSAQMNSFIKRYSGLISQLKKSLPDTRIIVSLIFPVDTKKAAAPRFKMVGQYNAALKKMCKAQGVEYLDSTSLLKQHMDCLGKDGIHLSKKFYTDYWLKFIMRDKGLC